MLTLDKVTDALRTAINDRVHDGRGGQNSTRKRDTYNNVTHTATRIGITYSYLSIIRHGKATPVGLMLRMAQELGAEVKVTVDGVELV